MQKSAGVRLPASFFRVVKGVAGAKVVGIAFVVSGFKDDNDPNSENNGGEGSHVGGANTELIDMGRVIVFKGGMFAGRKAMGGIKQSQLS